MLLRDGGKYVNRLGEVVTVKWRGNLAYPFTDLSGLHTYDENGLVFELNDPSDEDLVAEYKEPDDIIRKAVLTEYIRNRLAALEVSELYTRQIELEDLLTHFNVEL